MTLPKHYYSNLSRKDKKKQLRSLKKSQRSYKKGKYVSRPKLKSFKEKKSTWTQKFHKLYPKPSEAAPKDSVDTDDNNLKQPQPKCPPCENNDN